MIRYWFAVTALGVTGVVALGACDDDGEGCEQDSDCVEVVCPDGSKVTECNDGTCFVIEDCESGSGW